MHINGEFTEWEYTKYELLQLLPPGNFEALLYNDDSVPWTFYRQKLDFIALANVATHFCRQLTADHQRHVGSFQEYRKPYERQELVGVCWYSDTGMQVVDDFANCLGILQSDADEADFAKERLTDEQIAKCDFSIGAAINQ